MADFFFNSGKGIFRGFHDRANDNDPANSALILVPLSASGTEVQGRDLDDLAEIEADANFAERTSGSWVRKILESAQLAPSTVNHTNDRGEAALPSVTWTTPAAANNTTGLLVCYDSDTTGGADSAIIPITHHTFAVTTDGNDVVLTAGDYARGT